MNDTQRRIVGIGVLVVGIVVIMFLIEAGGTGVAEFDQGETTATWIIGLVIIGYVEYRLFSDENRWFSEQT